MNMSMGLSLGLVQEQRCVLKLEVSVPDASTDTIFPALQELLYSDTEYQEDLTWLVGTRRLRAYRSLIDALYCAIIVDPEDAPTPSYWSIVCRRYYKGVGPPLIDHPSVARNWAKVARWEQKLIAALIHARECRLGRKVRPTAASRREWLAA